MIESSEDMMQPMNEGMDIDPDIVIQTQSNIIGQNAIRMALLEAAVQSLSQENQQLKAQLPKDTEVTEEGTG